VRVECGGMRIEGGWMVEGEEEGLREIKQKRRIVARQGAREGGYGSRSNSGIKPIQQGAPECRKKVDAETSVFFSSSL